MKQELGKVDIVCSVIEEEMQLSPQPKQKPEGEAPSAPSSKKQSYCLEERSDLLNTCCSDFNSLLFLTPPKIRYEGAVPTPSPARKEVVEGLPDCVLSQGLLNFLEREMESPAPPPSSNFHALRNLTNQLPEEEAPSVKKKADKSQFKFPDGGWVCMACQNYNFCGRIKCNRCGKVKTKDDPVGKPKHLLRRENEENDPPLCTKTSKASRKQLKERVGDWVCPSCQNINFAFRKQCNRCKLEKEAVATPLDCPHGFDGRSWNSSDPKQLEYYSKMPSTFYYPYSATQQQVPMMLTSHQYKCYGDPL